MKAKNTPEYVEKAVIYQIFLRSFTLDGTIRAAAEMLPYLRELGVDILYICPHTVADDCSDRQYWSDRQKKSGLENPRNPYRLKDYFLTDPEYGTDQDMKDFIARAHKLGMRVIFDLVYYHCGPTANLIGLNPGFVKRDRDGKVEVGPWHFPVLNFDCPELCEYLYSNMEYFIREFDVDGYRTDAEDHTPLDFWEKARTRMEKIKPDIFMLAESHRMEGQLKAYDANYFWWASEIRKRLKGESVATLREYCQEQEAKAPEGARFLRLLDNHDVANDAYEERSERVLGQKAMNAGYFLCFTMDGIPFLYSGNEIADAARHSIYSCRNLGKTYIVDWAKGLTPAGRSRFNFVQELIRMRRSEPALTRGVRNWLETDCPDSIIAFTRICPEQRVAVIINLHDKTLSTIVALKLGGFEKIMSESADCRTENGTLKADLLPYGFAIIQY